MGIRKMLQSLRDNENGALKDLEITPEARGRARTHLESRDADGPLAFRVETVPGEIGFKVRVSIGEIREGEAPRSEFGDLPVVVGEEDWGRLHGFTIAEREGRFVTFANVTVHVNETPNPDSRKFTVNRALMTEGSATYTAPAGDADPLLARMILGIEGIKRVFFIDTFCTATRSPEADWDGLQHEVGRRLQAYLAHGGDPLPPQKADTASLGGIEAKIVEILETAVRPAVQRDGGDIAFAGFEDGRVELYMLGSCVGCPSSMATLKMGVEGLLKEAVPEVREVVAIS